LDDIEGQYALLWLHGKSAHRFGARAHLKTMIALLLITNRKSHTTFQKK